MPGATKIVPRLKYGKAFPASRYNDPRGGRPSALERNILRYRATEAALYLFYAEDTRNFLIKTVYPASLRSPSAPAEVPSETERLQGVLAPLISSALKAGTVSFDDAERLSAAIDGYRSKKLKAAIGHAVAIKILGISEAKELHELLQYRNDLAHRLHDVVADTSRLEFVTSGFDFRPPKYKADALDRLRALRKLLSRRSFQKLIYMVSFDGFGFELAQKVYEEELKRLDRLISRQIAREQAAWSRLRPQLDLTGTGLEGDLHPRHPDNHRPRRHTYGDDWEPETGHLTKRGVEICYRLFDLDRSPMAVAWLMGITLRSAERRYASWLKAGGRTRPRSEVVPRL
jgi:hypothetical protein